MGLSGWRPTRRSVLQAIGLSGLGAAANMAGVVQTGVAGVGVGAGVRALPVLPAPRARLEESFTTGWQSVQLHTHSNRVVAQLPWTSPRKVFEWYMEHGFKVVALTNLLHFTPVDGVAALLNDPGWFLVVQGEEPSFEPDGPGVRSSTPWAWASLAQWTRARQPWHHDGGDLDEPVGRDPGRGGLPILAHPNLTWAATAKDIAEADPKHDPLIIELCNTEPGINWRGGGGRPGVEEMWDQALTRSKRRILVICADDSHHFDTDDQSKSRRPDEPVSPPGRAGRWSTGRAHLASDPSGTRGPEHFLRHDGSNRHQVRRPGGQQDRDQDHAERRHRRPGLVH